MRVILALVLVSIAASQNEFSKDVQLFGHSIKNGRLVANKAPPHYLAESTLSYSYICPKEITLFEHNCTVAPCAVTQIHCPTAGPTGWESSLLKIYVDDEATPGIVLPLADLAHIGKFNKDGNEKGHIPWGVSLFGHTATNGGVYSTVRIPFGANIKLTLTSTHSGTFWFIVRGLERYHTVLGDLILPSAARLQVIQKDVTLSPQELTTLAEISADSSGVLLSVKLDSTSNDYNYLEACMRIYIDQAKESTATPHTQA